MDQAFTLPLQVVYLTGAALVFLIWFYVNKRILRKYAKRPSVPQKPKKVIFFVALSVIIYLSVSGYYDLWQAFFHPSTVPVSAYQVSPVVDKANLILFLLGVTYAAILPLFILQAIAAIQAKSGFKLVKNNVNPDPEYQAKSTKSFYATLQVLCWVFFIVGLQYFLVSSFWQGLITFSGIEIVLLQVMKMKRIGGKPRS